MVGFPVVVCVDGSERSVAAAAAGLAILGPDATPIVVNAMDEPDPTLVTGSGIAPGVVSPEDFERQHVAELEAAKGIIRAALVELHLEQAESHVLRGDAGAAICQYAREIDAGAIVLGTRGRSGLKRAVLGSVSDYVVRHAPCPVVVTGERDE